MAATATPPAATPATTAADAPPPVVPPAAAAAVAQPQRHPQLEQNHGSRASTSAAAAPSAALAAAAPAAAAVPSAAAPSAATAVAQLQIDLSDSNSYSSADDDSGRCEIVELVGNKGKTSFICLSGDVQWVMLEKVKANCSKGDPNVLSCEIAMMMLRSVLQRGCNSLSWQGG